MGGRLRQAHVVVVPYPAQGHVKPLLHLSHRLVDHGIKVTFMNTESIHAKVTSGMSQTEIQESRITLASVPDGLETESDRNNFQKFLTTFRRVVPAHFINLIEEIDDDDEPGPAVSFVIVDVAMGWILDVARSIGLEGIPFFSMSAATLVFFSNIPNLIQAGTIDCNGKTMKVEEKKIIVSEDNIPPWCIDEVTWSFPAEDIFEKPLFEFYLTMKETLDHANWLLCNTFDELEQPACNLFPKIIPIGGGSFQGANTEEETSGSFWKEDTSCLTWLNKQEPSSVIYVSFGSIAVMSQSQFNELALGLQQSGQPFLWIVRESILHGFPLEYPEGFLEATAACGKIVQWAPQDKVLSHPAIACFLSHCGWNSVLEGVSAGVPFLCWPFFADQFHNSNYICDAWKVGLKLNPDKSDSISGAEICMKIGQLLSDGDIKENATKIESLLQESCCTEGSSFRNMENFINYLKA